jgi:hypothetical protein
MTLYGFFEISNKIIYKGFIMVTINPPNSLQHSPHHNFTIPIPFWSQDFKLQKWSSSDIPINSFFNFSTITKYFPIISCGIIIDLKFDSMIDLPFTLTIDDVGGICFVGRCKLEPNSGFLMVA